MHKEKIGMADRINVINLKSEYYGDEIHFSDLFRVNNNELERYCGNGKWHILEGLLRDYQGGAYRNLYQISEEKARELMEITDNPDAEYRPQYTKRHEELLKRVFLIGFINGVDD